jgi:hypothetical protein
MFNGPQSPASKRIIKSIVNVSVIVLVVIILALVLFVGYKLLNNAAQQQARIMGAYAKQHHLIKFRTNGDPGLGLDNTTPWQQIYFRTPEQPSALKNSLEGFLRTNGYKMNDNFFDPAPCLGPDGGVESIFNGPPGSPNCPLEGGGGSSNGGQPYWVIWGTKNNTIVEAEITNISYLDSSDTSNPYKNFPAQHPVPPGNVVLNISFETH